MPIRFATLLLIPFLASVMDIAAGTITLYPTADQSASDIESLELGTSFDGLFDRLESGTDPKLTVLNSPGIGWEVRSALEFVLPPSLLLNQISHVSFRVKVVGRSLGDEEGIVYLNTYPGDGAITLSDFSNRFAPDIAFSIASPFPEMPFVEFDLTSAIQRDDSQKIGVLIHKAPDLGSPSFASSEFAATSLPEYSPQLIISYNPVPEPLSQVTLSGLLCGVPLLKKQIFLYRRRNNV